MMKRTHPRTTRLVLGLLVAAQTGAPVAIAADVPRGTMAGIVVDKETQAAVENVQVDALSLTSENAFQVFTNPDGGYYLADAPADVYGFTLKSDGIDYPVSERLDVRVGMRFLLEGCFELDRQTRKATVRDECDSGYAPQTLVATMGPHRFMRASPGEPLGQEPPGQEDAPIGLADLSQTENYSLIEHEGIECLTYEHYPQVDAKIEPGDTIQNSRVYFRSDLYPDFYYVDMQTANPTIDDFRAILPKPSRETHQIIYYIEALDEEFIPSQTGEFDPDVLDVETCKERGGPAWYDGEPAIVLGATSPGAAAVPPGFEAIGITGFISSLGVMTAIGGGAAAGGGALAGTSLVLVVSGAAAAGTVATVVVVKEEEASPPK